MLEQELTFNALEVKRRSIEEQLRSENESLSLRMRRAISWGLRGDDALTRDDLDAAFIFYWVAFNAVYGEEREERTEEREKIARYLQRIVRLDHEAMIYRSLWAAYSGPVRVLLENQYVYGPFWKHFNGTSGYEGWRQRFEEEQRKVQQALGSQDALTMLTILFDRLYVLRNQLVHGGATWNGSINRSQVRDGAGLIAFLARQFISLMLGFPTEEWGPAYYPVVQE